MMVIILLILMASATWYIGLNKKVFLTDLGLEFSKSIFFLWVLDFDGVYFSMMKNKLERLVGITHQTHTADKRTWTAH